MIRAIRWIRNHPARISVATLVLIGFYFLGQLLWQGHQNGHKASYLEGQVSSLAQRDQSLQEAAAEILADQKAGRPVPPALIQEVIHAIPGPTGPRGAPGASPGPSTAPPRPQASPSTTTTTRPQQQPPPPTTPTTTCSPTPVVRVCSGGL